MQNNAQNQGIKNSWSFMEFARTHGRPKLTQPSTHVNSYTGEEFTSRSVAFVHPTEKDEQGRSKVTFVSFSSKLGELTPAEIAQRADTLQVVELAESGNYTLCGLGEAAWEDIDIKL